MQSHTGCICWSFLHCAFSNASLNYLHMKLRSHTDCICWTFLHCALSSVSSDRLSKRTHSHIGCICLTSYLYQFSSVSLKLLNCHCFCSNHRCQDFDPSQPRIKRAEEKGDHCLLHHWMGINDDDDEADKIPTYHLGFCLLGFCPLGLILHTRMMMLVMMAMMMMMKTVMMVMMISMMRMMGVSSR